MTAGLIDSGVRVTPPLCHAVVVGATVCPRFLCIMSILTNRRRAHQFRRNREGLDLPFGHSLHILSAMRVSDRVGTIRSQRWLIVFLLFIAVEWLLTPLHEPVTSFQVAGYLVSVFLTLLFIVILELVRRALPKWVGRVWVLLVSFLLSFILAASVAVYQQFGEFVSVSMLQFVINNPAYFFTFVRTYSTSTGVIGFLAVWAVVAWLWLPSGRETKLKNRWLAVSVAVFLGMLYLLVLNQLFYLGKGMRVTMDTSLAIAIKNLHRVTTNGLHEAERAAVQGYDNRDSIDVIVIINESFGKTAFNPKDSSLSAMPLLKEWLAADSSLFWFDQAFSNSSATDVSVPSILTGVAPYESMNKLHNLPLVWDWGKAGGARTMLFSAQLFTWANFREFLLTPGPDVIMTPEEMDLPLMNDNGVDELQAMQRFCDTLRQLDANTRIVAVYNSNALHAPFQQTSVLLQRQPSYTQAYRNGAAVLDASLERLRETLVSTDRLRNTLLIITGDHGETDSLRHSLVHRLYCFYDEIMNIPFLVRVPDFWRQTRPEFLDACRANQSQVISNLDILPTIIDALGANMNMSNRELAASLLGCSWLRPVDSLRFCIALNTNDIRRWEHEGFGIYWHSRRFVYSDLERGRYFDITADPEQKHDLWPSVSDSERAVVEGVIDSVFHLKRMYIADPR
jgi:phosphoglycerol transferase MdoB-like AlkP superfamily enzyme